MATASVGCHFSSRRGDVKREKYYHIMIHNGRRRLGCGPPGPPFNKNGRRKFIKPVAGIIS
jgi:hypothetical protein